MTVDGNSGLVEVKSEYGIHADCTIILTAGFSFVVGL